MAFSANPPESGANLALIEKFNYSRHPEYNKIF
jgi:hypothetical protein